MAIQCLFSWVPKIRLVTPDAILFNEMNISAVSHIAKCARVCYGKEAKGPNQEIDEKMVEGLEKRHHVSMFRHASIYLRSSELAPYTEPFENKFANKYKNFYSCNYQKSSYDKTAEIILGKKESYEILSNEDFLNKCQEDPSLFSIYRLTFYLITQISTSRELNRVSPNNIAERSTRYCVDKDKLEICEPHWFDSQSEIVQAKYLRSCEESFETYLDLLKEGFKPEDARGVLPLDTLTKVIYTYPVWKWQDILDNRLYDKTGPAHPNCHVVMQEVRDLINNFAERNKIEYRV